MSENALTTQNNNNVLDFLNDIGGVSGEVFRLSKDGHFRTVGGDEEVKEGREFTCPYPEIQAGWVRLQKGEPAQHAMGPVFKDFRVPSRESLGENDPTGWKEGLSGKPESPWKRQILLPLVCNETGQPFVFQTTSNSGLRSVGRLMDYCRRMQQRDSEHYPVIKLKTGGFEHEKFGFIRTPDFPVVGKTKRNSAEKSDTSVANDLSDEIPW
jgi:hypothetical protein